MAEKLAGYEPENPRRGGGIRGALAGLGLLVSGEAVASDSKAEDTPTPAVAEALSEEVAAEIRDCVADGKTYRKEWLMERARAEEVSRGELKAWLKETMKTDDFSDAMQANMKACYDTNHAIEMAALDERMAAAREAFAAEGYELREDEDFNTALYLDDVLAARLVQKVSLGEDGTLQSSRWELDFSPLDEYLKEVRDDTDELRQRNQAMRQEIEDIWQRIEDRALGSKEAAELSADDGTERIPG